jgi:uncharacterized protein (DUF2249 family)/iron-sulfur cluster repair protein YtfE (RIC family)
MTTNLVIATTAADAAAAEAVEQHHAELLGALTGHVETLVRAAVAADSARISTAQDELVRWCERELVPHALGEEQTLYPPAHGMEAGRLLVTAMIEEHVVLRGLVAQIAAAEEPVRAAAAATALRVLFESHMTKENEHLLPLLAGSPTVSLAELLDAMHDAVAPSNGHEHADHASTPARSHDHGGCNCGERDEGMPELDARLVPHAIRHATIFGALDAVAPGRGMVLVAPHDPLPLLAQIEQRLPGAFAVDYLERGPEAWRLQFVRSA